MAASGPCTARKWIQETFCQQLLDDLHGGGAYGRRQLAAEAGGTLQVGGFVLGVMLRRAAAIVRSAGSGEGWCRVHDSRLVPEPRP